MPLHSTSVFAWQLFKEQIKILWKDIFLIDQWNFVLLKDDSQYQGEQEENLIISFTFYVSNIFYPIISFMILNNISFERINKDTLVSEYLLVNI